KTLRREVATEDCRSRAIGDMPWEGMGRSFVSASREITPLCGKPKSREQDRCTSGSVSRALRLGIAASTWLNLHQLCEWSDGMSDIGGKVTRVGASELGSE